MAETDIQLKQRAVIELLTGKDEKLTCIQEHLLRVHGESAVEVSAV
jgi:hypothetical protein